MKKKYGSPRRFRLNEIESIVDDHLKKSGDNFSAFARKAIVFYLESDRPKAEISLDEIVKALKKMGGNLSRIGGNLNQLAFHYNTTGIVHENTLAKSHEELRKEFAILANFFRKFEQDIQTFKG